MAKKRKLTKYQISRLLELESQIIGEMSRGFACCGGGKNAN